MTAPGTTAGTGAEGRIDEALRDATAALVAAVSAYEHYVGRHARRSIRDPLFTTRYADMQKAVERAQNACRMTTSDLGKRNG